MPPTHPGTIAIHDLRGSREEVKRWNVADIPVSVAYVKVDGKEVPVVKIVLTTQGGAMHRTAYGEGGRFLSATMGAPPRNPKDAR